MYWRKCWYCNHSKALGLAVRSTMTQWEPHMRCTCMSVSGNQHHWVCDGDGAVSAQGANDRRRLARVPVGSRRCHSTRLGVCLQTVATSADCRLAAHHSRIRSHLVSQSVSRQYRRCCCCGCFFFFFFFSCYRQDTAKRQTAGINLLTSQKSAFSPRRGISLHRFTWNLAWPRGKWVCFDHTKFNANPCTGWERGPKSGKFPLFGKGSSRRGEPFDRYLQFLGAFMPSVG